MKYSQLKKHIEQVFMRLGVYTTDSRNISLMILASGKKIDYNTFNDIMSFNGKIDSYLKKMNYDKMEVLYSQLATDVTLNLLFIRALVDSQQITYLPITPKAQADLCKSMFGEFDYVSALESFKNE